MISRAINYTPITHPVDLPAGPYLVYGTDALTHSLINLIRLARPEAIFSGFFGTGG